LSPALRLPARVAALLVVAIAAPLLAPSPAQAHPFGPPQTVTVEADDQGDVRVQWRVGGTDDLTLLGISLGVIPEDRVMLDGAVVFEDGDAAMLAAAPELGDYLLGHVEVSSGGTACTGEAVVTDGLAVDGAALTYDCGEAVTTAAVQVTTLTDLHPAYRTLATGPDGQRAVYDAEQPSHEWTLADGAPATQPDDLGTSAAVQIGLVLGGLLLAGLAVLVVLAWTRRSRQS
jgi:hypothetical protein